MNEKYRSVIKEFKTKRNETRNKKPATETLSKTQRCEQIGQIIQELLTTEEDYINILIVINFGYKKRSEDLTVVHLLPDNFEDKFKTIFFNTDKLLKFHEELLEELDKCAHSTDLLAKCFIRRERHMADLYIDFSMNQYNCNATVKHPELQPFFQTCRTNLRLTQNLNVHLFEPIQRIIKYRLLLEDMLRKTHNQHLNNALNCIYNTLRNVNESLSCPLHGLPQELLEKGKVILQGKFKVQPTHDKSIFKRTKKHVFLFDNVIIVSTDKHLVFKYDHHLSLAQVGVSRSVGGAREFLLSVKGEDKGFVFRAPTEMDCKVWLDKISDKVIK